MEDIESNFAQLNILLKKEYTILWVRNGQEAINSFIREKPDLILMDIRMPVMDGIQATEKIRTISLSVPIIAVTAYAFYTEQQQAIQAGCNGSYLQTIFFGETERNDRNLYRIINFLKGDQHSES